MMAIYLVLIVIGMCGGSLIATGFCALITSTGIITRMADKSHTASFIIQYETIITVGAILWNVFWLYNISFPLSQSVSMICQIIIGIFQGIFVGCLAVSLAETLNGTAILSRRVKLSKGVGVIILFTAFGKSIFSILQFIIQI